MHIKSKHGEKQTFKCSICAANFSQKLDLDKHISSFHPFKCVYCDVIFTKKQMLVIHLESLHEEENPFKCNICTDSFTLKR